MNNFVELNEMELETVAGGKTPPGGSSAGAAAGQKSLNKAGAAKGASSRP